MLCESVSHGEGGGGANHPPTFVKALAQEASQVRVFNSVTEGQQQTFLKQVIVSLAYMCLRKTFAFTDSRFLICIHLVINDGAITLLLYVNFVRNF